MKGTLSITALVLCVTATSGISQLHENIGPGGEENKTFITKARSGQYSLIQKPAHLESCDEEGGWPCYQTTVHFRDKSKPDQVLPEVGLARQASYQMQAEYVISPNERWFVRDQHLFAGCNILVLYKIEPDGKVRQEQSDLIDLGLRCVLEDLHQAKKTQLSPEGFFHFSGEDVVWSHASDAFQFKLFARPDPPDPSIRDCIVRYDLRTGKMTHGKIPLFDSKTGDKIEALSAGSTSH
jgi:hypothetical protein